jgi:NADH:ubiquinone oxidoreductase subunit E
LSEKQEKMQQIERYIAEYKGDATALMRVMQYAQNVLGCVPMDVQIKIAEGLGVTLSEVYGVATFYSQFSLEPKGKYIISVCMGTACYVRGSQGVLDRICEELDIQPGKTSKDGKFTLQATRCIGACGLAPVMTINDEVHGRIVADDVPGILQPYIEK